jgi:hypothetical protein
MDHETVVAYLNRAGVTAPAAGDAAGLRALHRAHQLTVPFENLSIHLGRADLAGRARPDRQDRSPVAAAAATTRCCLTPGMTKMTQPAGSGSPTPARETSTS